MFIYNYILFISTLQKMVCDLNFPFKANINVSVLLKSHLLAKAGRFSLQLC